MPEAIIYGVAGLTLGALIAYLLMLLLGANKPTMTKILLSGSASINNAGSQQYSNHLLAAGDGVVTSGECTLTLDGAPDACTVVVSDKAIFTAYGEYFKTGTPFYFYPGIFLQMGMASVKESPPPSIPRSSWFLLTRMILATPARVFAGAGTEYSLTVTTENTSLSVTHDSVYVWSAGQSDLTVNRNEEVFVTGTPKVYLHPPV